MLTQKDRDFIAKLDLSKWDKRDQFFVMWGKIYSYVMANCDWTQAEKLNQMMLEAQIRFGKEEMERRNNGRK